MLLGASIRQWSAIFFYLSVNDAQRNDYDNRIQKPLMLLNSRVVCPAHIYLGIFFEQDGFFANLSDLILT